MKTDTIGVSVIENLQPFVFKNGVKVFNVTPHPLSFQDGDEVVTVPSTGLLINARIVNQETKEGDVIFCVPSFETDPTSEGLLRKLEEVFPGTLVVGSIIAAQAYPGRVVGMVPAPGFERVPPAEKRMDTFRFTRYNK